LASNFEKKGRKIWTLYYHALIARAGVAASSKSSLLCGILCYLLTVFLLGQQISVRFWKLHEIRSAYKRGGTAFSRTVEVRRAAAANIIVCSSGVGMVTTSLRDLI
jgi:hypothetical protein